MPLMVERTKVDFVGLIQPRDVWATDIDALQRVSVAMECKAPLLWASCD